MNRGINNPIFSPILQSACFHFSSSKINGIASKIKKEEQVRFQPLKLQVKYHGFDSRKKEVSGVLLNRGSTMADHDALSRGSGRHSGARFRKPSNLSNILLSDRYCNGPGDFPSGRPSCTGSSKSGKSIRPAVSSARDRTHTKSTLQVKSANSDGPSAPIPMSKGKIVSLDLEATLRNGKTSSISRSKSAGSLFSYQADFINPLQSGRYAPVNYAVQLRPDWVTKGVNIFRVLVLEIFHICIHAEHMICIFSTLFF